MNIIIKKQKKKKKKKFNSSSNFKIKIAIRKKEYIHDSSSLTNPRRKILVRIFPLSSFRLNFPSFSNSREEHATWRSIVAATLINLARTKRFPPIYNPVSPRGREGISSRVEGVVNSRKRAEPGQAIGSAPTTGLGGRGLSTRLPSPGKNSSFVRATRRSTTMTTSTTATTTTATRKITTGLLLYRLSCTHALLRAFVICVFRGRGEKKTRFRGKGIS